MMTAHVDRFGAPVRVAIAADHAGLALRARVAEAVTAAGHEPVLMGPDSGKPVDYPLVAVVIGEALASGDCERAILLCGSGAGVTVAANRLPGIRAAYGSDHYTAHQMVEHDHVNVLTLGARVMGPEDAADIVEAFVQANFTPEERHQRRLSEVLELERDRSPDAATRLHDAGQSLWLDNITRALLASGTLASYISNFAVTGLTSNPTIFDKAMRGTGDYDAAIRTLAEAGVTGEALFFALAIEDLTKAAGLLRPIWDATQGVDGWVSLEVSPVLANDTDSTIAEAKALHAKAATPNLFIKVPGTAEGLPAIEELIFAGVSINVTLLFDDEQYLAAAGAYRRGLQRRKDAGLGLDVGSVASVFISRWDKAVMGKLPDELADELGIAVAKRTYRAYRGLLASDEWKALEAAGAKPQRLLWASTGTKDPALPDTFYIHALAAAKTINTMPEETLKAFAAHGIVDDLLAADGGDVDDTIAAIEAAGVSVKQLAAQLQVEGAKSFVDSWTDLLQCVESKTVTVTAH